MSGPHLIWLRRLSSTRRYGILLFLLLGTLSLLAHDSTKGMARHQVAAREASSIQGTRTMPTVLPSTNGGAAHAPATRALLGTTSHDLLPHAAVPAHVMTSLAQERTESGVASASPRSVAAGGHRYGAGKTGTQSVVRTPLNVVPLSFSAQPLAAVTLAAHPRLLLSPATLTSLNQRVVANTHEWQLLKATCDSFIGGTVEYPTGNAYPNLPNLGPGYQGESYLPALLAEGLCYQVLKTSAPSAAAPYGAKAVDILMKMSTPYSTAGGNQGWNPCTDSGYGIRNYGVGFGLGYDWVYGLLNASQRSQVYTTANAWLTAWEQTNGCAAFEYAHPQSNYYAGYFHAKAVIALATYEENPSAPAEWTDWLGNQFGQRVQPYYALHLSGGGWPEGFGNYAPLGILNMTLPVREVKTATGQDLVNASARYAYPLDSASYAMHFTWPSRSYIDDRDTNHATSNTQPPGTTPLTMFVQLLGELSFWNSSQVGVFNQYLNEVSVATSGFDPADAWLLFLDTDPAAPTTPLSTLPLSYLASGMGAVAARSSWNNSASWMSFRAGPYINNPGQGEEYFDQGSLALVSGGAPLLVNAGGWLVHNPNGSADENSIYNDNYGSFNGSVLVGNRQLYNVFYVRSMSGSSVLYPFGQGAYTTENNQVRTQVTGFDDGGDYVYTMATHLEDMYRSFGSNAAVSAWSRQVVYLRPNRFVVYDRTTKGNVAYDQYMAWHFPAAPTTGTAAAGQNRIDVTYSGQHVGAMTTVLPVNATLTTSTLYPGSSPTKVWQVQVRPPGTGVSQSWLTVFDLSSTAATVASDGPVTITQGAAVGVQLLASDGNSYVISGSGAPGTQISGPLSYSVPALLAHHVITDLAPGAGYSVTATVSGNIQSITVTAGGTHVTSTAGVLSYYLDASGAMVAKPPVYFRLPISSLPVSGYPAPYTH